MRTIIRNMAASLAILLIALAISGCALSLKQEIRTENASEQEITGMYSLILYGGGYGTDLEAVAILAKEGAPFAIVPYAPEFEYRILRNLPAKEALATAHRFVSVHPAFSRAQLSKIIDSGGNLLGYEMRPLYSAFTYGLSDVLDIYYWKKGNTVLVKMRLIPELEKKLFEDSDKSGNR